MFRLIILFLPLIMLMNYSCIMGQALIPTNLIEVRSVSDSTRSDSLNASNETTMPRVFFFGNSHLTSSEDLLNSVSASGKLQAIIKPFEKWLFSLSYNRVGVTPSSVPKDSIDFNTLIFPDAGNTGFQSSVMFRQNLCGGRNLVYLSPYFEFSVRNSKVQISTTTTETDTIAPDSIEVITNTVNEEVSFSSLNYNIGVKLEYTYIPSDAEKATTYSITPYFHFFNVPNEDADNFYRTLGKVPPNNNGKKSSISAFGCKIALTYKGLSIFGDFRHNNHVNGFDISDTAIEGFVFNIGTSISMELLKF